MFTPFIQYTIDSQDLTKPPKTAQPQNWQNEKVSAGQQEEQREQKVLDIAEVTRLFGAKFLQNVDAD